MRAISVQNPDDALQEGLLLLLKDGVVSDSRNGPVLRTPYPVMTVYNNPRQRVLFSPLRDANPFFHLFEALWMLAGRNDIDFVANIVPRMREFSDDGEVQHGAYGFRWRHWFGFDQLNEIVEMLKTNPNDRRCVLAMWSPNGDMVASEGIGGRTSKDVPCNTHCYFAVTEGRLDLTVCCRSNDVVWGAYGANVVHFSMLLEWVAFAVKLPVGRMYQLSNNYHVYSERPDVQKLLTGLPQLREASMYGHPIIDIEPRNFFMMEQQRIQDYLDNPKRMDDMSQAGWLSEVAAPMWRAFCQYKEGRLEDAITTLRNRVGPHRASLSVDWHVAGEQWLRRRLVARAAKEVQA